MSSNSAWGLDGCVSALEFQLADIVDPGDAPDDRRALSSAAYPMHNRAKEPVYGPGEGPTCHWYMTGLTIERQIHAPEPIRRAWAPPMEGLHSATRGVDGIATLTNQRLILTLPTLRLGMAERMSVSGLMAKWLMFKQEACVFAGHIPLESIVRGEAEADRLTIQSALRHDDLSIDFRVTTRLRKQHSTSAGGRQVLERVVTARKEHWSTYQLADPASSALSREQVDECMGGVVFEALLCRALGSTWAIRTQEGARLCPDLPEWVDIAAPRSDGAAPVPVAGSFGVRPDAVHGRWTCPACGFDANDESRRRCTRCRREYAVTSVATAPDVPATSTVPYSTRWEDL